MGTAYDPKIIEPPANAYWFALERDQGEEWERVELDAREWFRVSDAPSPEQVALAAGPATYRIEWRQKNRNLRKCGYSPAFEIAGGGAAPPAVPAAEDDEPAPTPKKAKPAPAPAPAPLVVERNTLSELVSVVDHLTHTIELRYRALDADRETRAITERAFMLQTIGLLNGERDRTNQVQAQSYERILLATKATSDAEQRAALAVVAPPSQDLALLAAQLDDVRQQLEARDAAGDAGEDDDDEPVNLEPVIRAGVGLLRFIAQSKWALEKWPELAQALPAAAAE